MNGVYHVYYSVSSFGSQNSAIGLATSNTMDEGTWTDHGSTGIRSDSSKQYNAIDANLFNDNGNYLMTFGSFWQDIFQAPMNSAATKVASASYNIAFDPAGTHAVEGPYLYKYGDYYYLFYSAGICCGYDSSMPAAGEEYKIKVCRSSSATGNFVSVSHGWICSDGADKRRLMRTVLLVQTVVARWCWKATIMSTGLVDSMFFPATASVQLLTLV